MNYTRVLYHLALADFLERVRRYRFLLVLGAMIFLGVLINDGSLRLRAMSNVKYDEYIGQYNSAWVGSLIVLVSNFFLGWFGFYLVKDCIERDIRTGVGQIIATTAIRRGVYLFGKWLSNLLVLLLLVGILALAGIVLRLMQGSGYPLEAGAMLMPFFALSIPTMALVSAAAVVFETIPLLRGTLGNLVYFFLFIVVLSTTFGTNNPWGLTHDPLGLNLIQPSIEQAAQAAYPDESISGLSINYNPNNPSARRFIWSGVAWTVETVAKQWSWVLVAMGLVLLSTLWFARFDPSHEGTRRLQQLKPKGLAIETKAPELIARALNGAHHLLPDISPLISRLAQTNPFLGVFFAELRMTLKGNHWWWWAGMVGINLAMLTGTVAEVQKSFLLAAFVWPLAIWSHMGSREKQNNTYQFVFASARPVLRQLPAVWLAGVLATALFGLGGAINFAAHNDLPALAAWLGGTLFVPSLALALGVFTEGTRLFEIVYLCWWYVGALQDTPGLNYLVGQPVTYLAITAGLLAFSAAWRARQVRG